MTSQTVRINGEKRQIEGPLSVAQLLQKLGLDPTASVVERNRDIVELGQFGTVLVGDGDELEIVHFVGGG